MNAPVSSDAIFRAKHVGAGEVAALFDASPWLTAFELHHRKRGTIATPEFNARNADGTPENSRIHWGVKLERLIVGEACERWGYTLGDHHDRLSNGKGLGGHPDQLAICPERGAGVLEVKTVDWLERKKWGDEPPANYLLQAQTYAGLAGVQWVDLIVMVLGGGTDIQRFQCDFRPGLYAEIERRVATFWQGVEAGKAPPVDYTRDGSALVESIGAPTDEVIDLRDDLDAEQAALDFTAAKARKTEAEGEMEAAKARLIERVGAAGEALLPSFRLKANMTAGTPDREAKPGEIIKGRKGYRRFDLKGTI